MFIWVIEAPESIGEVVFRVGRLVVVVVVTFVVVIAVVMVADVEFVVGGQVRCLFIGFQARRIQWCHLYRPI